MRAVVTGGAGFIGGAIAGALVERGDEVVVVDNLSNGDESRVPRSARFVVADIRDLDAMQNVFGGAEVVFHQAALRSVPRSLKEPLVVHDVNATGTLNVLIAAERSGVKRVVNASSSSVYGGALEGRSSEDILPYPLSPYAVSKLAAEYYCRVWSGLDKVETVSLRYFNVFGPGQRADSKYAAVFPAFISALTRGQPPEIHWDGEQSRDFTFIDDVVSGNLLAARAEAADSLVINLAGGRPRTINETFEKVQQIVGTDVEPTRVPKRGGDIRHSFADRRLAEQVLGWRPQYDWHDAVRATVSWFLDNERAADGRGPSEATPASP